jgi:hypothetical protein
MPESAATIRFARDLSAWLGAIVIALYLATPFFAWFQWWQGISMRLPSLLGDRPGLAVGYYVAMTALGVLMVYVARPVAELLAILESAVNLGLTSTALALGYVAMLDRATDLMRPGAVSPEVAVNFSAVFFSLGTILLATLARYLGPRRKQPLT